MVSISRRQFLAVTAGAAVAGALPPFLSRGSVARAASPTTIRAQSRIIDVGGRAANVLGLLQPDGTHGLTLDGPDFAVRLENALAEATLIHWHGLTPPFGQDGVPGMPQPLLEPGKAYDYRFPVLNPGTHWMHAHTLQEQQLLAAPLVVKDPGEASLDEQDVVVLLHDFSFKSPEELLAGLTGMAGHGGGSGHGSMMHAPAASASMPMDVNDIEYDAYLANDRTLDDPAIFRVERSGSVRLRLINGATATAFWIDTGSLAAQAIAVDGNSIAPVNGTRFPLGMGQRIDIRLRIPQGEGAWPILAEREGAIQRTGFVLATAKGAIKPIAASADTPTGALDLKFEAALRATKPFAPSVPARRKEIVLGGHMEMYAWTLNGKGWGEHDPVIVGTGERVEISMRNDSPMGHPMHLHGHHFQVVEIGGLRLLGAVRDTVWVSPGRSVVIAFDANNPGEWAFHCHHLYHMAAGMMTAVKYSA
jgi:FtsP/CotA-like multicopper oxidase with cupredoxin domain